MKMTIYLLGLLLGMTSVVINSSQFGERIKKDVNNSSLIDLVFRPQSKDSGKGQAINQANIPGVKRSQKVVQNSGNKEKGINLRQRLSDNLEIDGKQNASNPQIESTFDTNSKLNAFEIPFHDISQLASSEHVKAIPIPPPPPEPPQYMPDFQRFQPVHNGEQNYEESGNRQTFYESAPKHSLGQQFSVNVPQSFPLIVNDPRADYKNERMGAQNYQGKPWGTKKSYTYRDPKNPHNFMEMSEVTMTINRQMDPQEAQSQIHRFLAAAQSGEYGPLSNVRADEDQNRHIDENDEYERTGASQIAPSEPLEPTEPKFPIF